MRDPAAATEAVQSFFEHLRDSVPAIGASTAGAYVTTDITNYNLTESTSTYNGGPYHISQSGGGPVSYRWFFGFVSQCFVLRGRTAVGYGSMNLHDGRLRR